MNILVKKIKSLLISISVVMIVMTGLTPCFGYVDDIMKKKELTVYEQYLKDYAEQVDKIYTPEKFFSQKVMQYELRLHLRIQPDGSITDIETDWSSEDLDHEDPTWIIRPIYFWRLKRLSRKHEQYVKELLVSNKAKPFPAEFGEYIYVNLEFRHWNAWFKKPIFKTEIVCRPTAVSLGIFAGPRMSATFFRDNYTSGK